MEDETQTTDTGAENGYEKAVTEGAAEGGKPEVSEARKKLVEKWCGKVTAAREKRQKTFKQMRDSQDFAMIGADKTWKDEGNYTVPLLPRYINQAVSTLYAKNPETTFKRRRRRQYKLWDGRQDTLNAAMDMAQMGDPESMMLCQEILAVRKENQMLDGLGETLEILWSYFLDEQSANYKQQLKALVRRVKTCKVGFINLGFQRALEPRPERVAEIADVTSKVTAVECALKDVADEKFDEMSAEMEQLKLNLADLERDKMMVVREGPVLDFYKADQVIIDLKCSHLKSLTGADWVAIEFEFTCEEVKKIFEVDIKSGYTPYSKDGAPNKPNSDKDSVARVWVIQDKINQQYLTVCDGYCDFLKEPATPDVVMDRFWSIFPVVFNEVEHYEEIYPMSDVEQAMDIQREYNRTREAVRQHRIAATPWWIEGAGLSQEEKDKIGTRVPHAVISMNSLGTGQKAADMIQAGPTAPIDPNLYQVEEHFGDLMRVVGYQEAQMGATSGSTATESSIAQNSQSISQADNTDDLDETLTDLARAAGQVMLLNLQKETVIEIVGEGAIWPDAPETREAAAKEIFLQAEAGSTGRPNDAAELANLERGMPIVTQLPGINPEPIGKRYLKLLKIDTEEGLADGMPSIQAINQILAKAAGGMGGAPTGDPATDPNAQGPAGASNAPQAAETTPGGQPAYGAAAPQVA